MNRILRALPALYLLALGGCDEGDEGWDASVDTGHDTQDVADVTVDDVPGDDLIVDGGPDVADDEVPPDTTGDEAGTDCDFDLGTFTPGSSIAGTDCPSYCVWQILASITPSFTPEPYSAVMVYADSRFGGPSSTGTYPLTSWEPLSTSGLSIMVNEECYGFDCSRYYMADTALLELTRLEVGMFGTIAGTLSGVHMVEVNTGHNEIIPDGLAYCLDTWNFNVTVL